MHDRYGQLVNVYTKLLLTKISFHLKVVSLGGCRLCAPAQPVPCPSPRPCHTSGCSAMRAGQLWVAILPAAGVSLQHPQFPAGLEVTDEVLEKAAGTDVNNM